MDRASLSLNKASALESKCRPFSMQGSLFKLNSPSARCENSGGQAVITPSDLARHMRTNLLEEPLHGQGEKQARTAAIDCLKISRTAQRLVAGIKWAREHSGRLNGRPP
jgi:hypothetical protein